MSPAVSSSAFVSRLGCVLFFVIGHLLQNPCFKGLRDTMRIRCKPRCPDLLQGQQFVGVDVLSLVFGERLEEHGEQAHLSQAVFARYLNLTVGYMSQLERGAKRPSGPALVLLNVIRRKGIEAIL
jgi:hypothetical protein